jgi:hypothetical protein
MDGNRFESIYSFFTGDFMLTRRTCLAAALSMSFALTAFANKPGEVSKPAAQAAAPTAPAEPAGMTPLFNGKDLSGWTGHPKLWSVQDGVIRGQTTAENKAPGNTFLIYAGDTTDGKQIKDFELRFSVKIQGGNSGLQYRSKRFPAPKGANKENEWIAGGYQCEVAGIPGKDGFLYSERGPGNRGYADHRTYLAWVGDKVEIDETGTSHVTGPLADNAAIAAADKKGEWNDYIIIAKGNHLQHFINGVQTIDCIDNDEKGRSLSGIIALQIHAGAPMIVEFKNIRIKEMDGK